MDFCFNYKNLPLLFIGNFSFDRITNHRGVSQITIGGSAYISSYAARIVSDINLKIKICSIVGRDFPLDIINFLKDKKIDVSEIKIIPEKSNSFIIKEKNNRSEIEIKHLLELDNFPIKERIKHLHVSCRKGIKSPYFYLSRTRYKKSSMDVIFSSLRENREEIKKSLKLIDILFLNYEEYKMLNQYMKKPAEISFPKVIFIITQGPKGVLIKKEKKKFSLPGIQISKRQIISTIGAGDVFLGSFLGAYYSFSSPARALAIATSMATLSLQNFGVSHISDKIDELTNYLSNLLPKYKKIEYELSKLFSK